MFVLDEIVKQLGGLESLRMVGKVRIVMPDLMVILEYLGCRPTADHSLRFVKCGHFSGSEIEVHFELREQVWLPVYFCNHINGAEISLWSKNNDSMCIDLVAGFHLIHLVWLLDVNLWASGFLEAAEESLYHPLFPAAGGAA